MKNKEKKRIEEFCDALDPSILVTNTTLLPQMKVSFFDGEFSYQSESYENNTDFDTIFKDFLDYTTKEDIIYEAQFGKIGHILTFKILSEIEEIAQDNITLNLSSYSILNKDAFEEMLELIKNTEKKVNFDLEFNGKENHDTYLNDAIIERLQELSKHCNISLQNAGGKNSYAWMDIMAEVHIHSIKYAGGLTKHLYDNFKNKSDNVKQSQIDTKRNREDIVAKFSLNPDIIQTVTWVENAQEAQVLAIMGYKSQQGRFYQKEIVDATLKQPSFSF